MVINVNLKHGNTSSAYAHGVRVQLNMPGFVAFSDIASWIGVEPGSVDYQSDKGVLYIQVIISSIVL